MSKKNHRIIKINITVRFKTIKCSKIKIRIRNFKNNSNFIILTKYGNSFNGYIPLNSIQFIDNYTKKEYYYSRKAEFPNNLNKDQLRLLHFLNRNCYDFFNEKIDKKIILNKIKNLDLDFLKLN